MSQIISYSFNRGSYGIQKTLHTPRQKPEENEDSHFIFATTDGAVTAGVFDGATGVGSVATPFKRKMGHTLGLNHDISGGVFASRIAAVEAERHAIDPYVSPKQLLLTGAEKLRRELAIIGVQQSCLTQVASTLGAIVRLSPRGTMEWALTQSDVNIVVTRKNGDTEWMTNFMPLDFHEGKSLALALRRRPHDISKILAEDPMIQEKINGDREKENVLTYGAINGDDPHTVEHMIAEGVIQLRKGDTVHLITDGSLLYKPEGAYDYDDLWNGLGNIFREHAEQQRERMAFLLHFDNGTRNFQAVMAQEAQDPTCTKWPRFKVSGDDKTRIDLSFMERF